MRACLMFLAAGLAFASPHLARAETLELVCRGTVRGYEQDASAATVFNTRGGPAGGSAAQGRETARPDEFRVRLEGGSGAVAPPPALIPWLTGPGLGDGWWALTGLSVSDGRIVGAYSHSVLYSPRVTIDRRTGAIDVKALAGSEFIGVCEAAPPEPARRF